MRGMADACLTAIGVETTAAAVAGLYADFLDGWLIDPGDAAPADSVGDAAGSTGGSPAPSEHGNGRRPVVRPRPLLMTDVEASAQIAAEALRLADELTPAPAR